MSEFQLCPSRPHVAECQSLNSPEQENPQSAIPNPKFPYSSQANPSLATSSMRTVDLILCAAKHSEIRAPTSSSLPETKAMMLGPAPLRAIPNSPFISGSDSASARPGTRDSLRG